MLFLTNLIDQFMVLGSCLSYTNYMFAGIIIIFLLLSVAPLIHLSVSMVNFVRNILIWLVRMRSNVAEFILNRKVLWRGFFICGLLISYLNLNLRALMDEVTRFQWNSFDIVIAKAEVWAIVAVGVLILGMFYANLKISDNVVARCSNKVWYAIEIIHLICVTGVTLCSAYIVLRASTFLDCSISDSITFYLSMQLILFFSRTAFLKYILNARYCFYPLLKILGMDGSPTWIEFDKVAGEIASSISAKTWTVRIIIFLVITIGMWLLSVAIKPWSIMLIASLTDFFVTFAIYINGGDFTKSMFKRAPREVSRMGLFRGLSQQEGPPEITPSPLPPAKKVEEALIHKANAETFKPLIEKLTSTTSVNLLNKVTVKEDESLMTSKKTMKGPIEAEEFKELEIQSEGSTDRTEVSLIQESLKLDVLKEIEIAQKETSQKLNILLSVLKDQNLERNKEHLSYSKELLAHQEEISKLRLKVTAQAEENSEKIRKISEDVAGLKKSRWEVWLMRIFGVGGAIGGVGTGHYLWTEREGIRQTYGSELPKSVTEGARAVGKTITTSATSNYKGELDDKTKLEMTEKIQKEKVNADLKEGNIIVGTPKFRGSSPENLITTDIKIEMSKTVDKILTPSKNSIGIPLICIGATDNVLHVASNLYTRDWIFSGIAMFWICGWITAVWVSYGKFLIPFKEKKWYLARAVVVIFLILLQFRCAWLLHDFIQLIYIDPVDKIKWSILDRYHGYVLLIIFYGTPVVSLCAFLIDLIIVALNKFKRYCGHVLFVQKWVFNKDTFYTNLTSKQVFEVWTKVTHDFIENTDEYKFNNLQKVERIVNNKKLYAIPDTKRKTYTLIVELKSFWTGW